MKTWKKVCGTVLLSLLVVGAAGCGSKSTPSKDGSKGDSKKLLMYQVGDKPENYDQLMEIANKKIKEKIGTTVDIQYIGWGDWDKKMPTIINSGENYDLSFAYQYTVNAQKGAFADLTELAPKYAKEYMDSLPDMYKKGNEINGKLYGIPVYGNAWAQQMLTFNKNFLDKYSIDISNVGNSYASATEALKKFHEQNPSTAGFAIGQSFKVSGDFDYPLGKDYPFAVKTTDSDVKIVNQYEDKDMKETFDTLHDWYKKGYIITDAATNSTAYPLEKDTWFMREETQGPVDYGDTILTNAAGRELVSKPLNGALKTTATAQMANFVISKTSKNKEKSMEFLNLLNTDADLLNGLVFGIEGKQWKKTGEGKLELLPDYKPNTHMSAWNTGNNMILYTQDTITKEMIEKRDNSMKEVKESPILGFSFKTDAVKTELSNIMNVMNRYMGSVNTGSVDPVTTLPKMKEDLKKAGWEKVQKEMQTQLDAFLKGK